MARNSLKYQDRWRDVASITLLPIMLLRGPSSCWFFTVWQVFLESLFLFSDIRIAVMIGNGGAAVSPSIQYHSLP